MVDDPTLLSISEASKQIEAGELSPVDLVELQLNKIEQLDGKLNAFVTVVPELAKKAAKEAETEIRAGRYRGPLHGIPIGIKDILGPLVWQIANVNELTDFENRDPLSGFPVYKALLCDVVKCEAKR